MEGVSSYSSLQLAGVAPLGPCAVLRVHPRCLRDIRWSLPDDLHVSPRSLSPVGQGMLLTRLNPGVPPPRRFNCGETHRT